ncbi:hypothetical protein MKX03_028527 [Papaver bracteatum]|nr:hypothetical protein MKX03_028527 [Papaver bracteatum]
MQTGEDNIDGEANVVVKLTVEGNDSDLMEEDTWNVKPKFDLNLSPSIESNLDGDGVSFSQAIQSPCCNQMERLSISSGNTSIPSPNLHAASESPSISNGTVVIEEMIDDDNIDLGLDLTKKNSEDEVEMLERTPPTHEFNSLETNSGNEGNVFEDFTESEDDPQIHTGFKFMANSKLHCSSYNEQSLGSAELGEGSELWVKKRSEDRISELPDALIHHIFSFLDMKYVVQTSVLSRRWRYLWSSLPTIEVVDIPFIKAGDSYEVTFNRFINFVDRLLLLRDSSDIQSLNLVWLTVKLHLDVIGRYDITSRLSTWIMAAVKHNIQELRLDLCM